MTTSAPRQKLLLFDHACHASTQSARFFNDVMASGFDLTVHTYDRFYRCGVPLKTAQTYDFLVYFEFLPGRLQLFYPHTRSIYVPMYDNEWGSKWRWRRLALAGIPIVSFCSRVSQFARAHGITRCLDVRFFPDPAPFIDMAGDPQIVLLWERGQISFETVKALFRPHDLKKVILLRHPEERLSYRPISESDILAYHVDIVDTSFLPFRQYLEVMRPAGTVIAPRKREGIGMAFLEAMAMRKCVIGHQDATMDEYIKHGHNGLLFDADAPRPISIDEVIRIHKNLPDPATHYARWTEDRSKIVPFIQATSQIMPPPLRKKLDFLYYLFFVVETLLFRMGQSGSMPPRGPRTP
jgi:hypothetical protein